MGMGMRMGNSSNCTVVMTQFQAASCEGIQAGP